MSSTRPNIKEYFIDMLKLVASRSTCIRRQVGAIITDKEAHVLSTGYNGVPRAFEHCIDVPCRGANDSPGNTLHCEAVHAEQNALLQCINLRDASVMYCNCTPCFVCAKMLANTNIQYIVCIEEYADKRGLDILLKAGITVEIYGGMVYENA